MKTNSALFISAFNKQNKLREMLSPARLPTKRKKLHHQKLAQAYKKAAQNGLRGAEAGEYNLWAC